MSVGTPSLRPRTGTLSDMAPHEASVYPDTSVVSVGRPERRRGSALNPPIEMSSTFVGVHAPGADDYVYARFSNRTWEPLEEAIAQLEGAPLPALSYASGMAAVSAALSLVPIGGVAVVPSTSYGGTVGLARSLHDEGALELREIDPSDWNAAIDAFEGADFVWLESPTNPLLDVLDLPALIAAAKQRGALVAIDNTFSTPLRQRPLGLGADLVVHSATKFIGGHSDVLLGVLVTADAGLRSRLQQNRTLHGAIPGPFESWLTLRGLRTLAVRLDRAEQNATTLATRLTGRKELSRVRYPGLPADPGHSLATAQLDGYGAIISIEFAGGVTAAERFMEALRLITPATSLGGVETLAERRRRQPGEPHTVPESLVRLSVGIENVEDLWSDISQALDA